jgi:hypothetical protein
VTPDQAFDMMQRLIRERDEMQETLASWHDLEASTGIDAISAEIRNRVEHVRQMMRNAAHLVDAIDETLKLYPQGVAPEFDAQRTKLLADRRAMLAMWNDLAGTAEKFNESLMRLAANRDA